jgi:hypothetical protein
MFAVHSDGLIAGDVFDSPATAIKAGFLGLFGGGTDEPPSLEEPAADAKLTKSELWWRDHVAQLRTWARERYGVELDRREALVLMGVGHPTINTVRIADAEYMLATPSGISSVDDGRALSYRFGLVQPGGAGLELPLR